MESIDRRRFIGTTAGGVAAGLAGVNGISSVVANTDAASESARTDVVPPPPMFPLGKTGIQLSRVGQGTGVSGGNRQSNQTRMGFDKLVSLFHHAYDRGITFFDMADLYGTHVYFREALRTIPRDKVTILTKL